MTPEKRAQVVRRLSLCSDAQLADVARNFKFLAAGFSATDREVLRALVLAEAERRGLTRNPVHPGHGKYVHARQESPSHFDPRSFRTKAVSPTKKIIVGCPRGHFKKGACATSTRVQAVLTAKNPPLGHNCRGCAEFCPDGLTPVERCRRYRDVQKVHGALLTRWTRHPSLPNQCSFWAPAPVTRGNPKMHKSDWTLGKEKRLVKTKDYSISRLEDGIISYDCERCGESFLEPASLRRHLAEKHRLARVVPTKNPPHPYVYEGTIHEYGGTRTVAPRSLRALLAWASRWLPELRGAYPEVAEEMARARIGAVVKYGNETASRELHIRKLVRNPMTSAEAKKVEAVAKEHMKDAHTHASKELRYLDKGTALGLREAVAMTANPRWKPNFKKWQDLVYFLETTLIPDLEESESSYVEDFNRLSAMLQGKRPVDLQYIQWLRTTLIPDTLASGREGTAHDLQEAVYWLAARDPRIRQHRPNPLTRREVGATLREAKRELDFARQDLRAGNRRSSIFRAGKAEGIAQTAARRAGPKAAKSMLKPRYSGTVALYRGAYQVAKGPHGTMEDRVRENPPVNNSYGLRPPVPGAKLIAPRALAVEYRDVHKAAREGVQDPRRPWRHGYTKKGTAIWGLPDGSVLFHNPGHPLWRSQPNTKTGK